MNSRATRPTSVPIANVMAESRNGGTEPEASVKSASNAHIATAEKPISVARPMLHIPGARHPRYFVASNLCAWTVIGPICVPTVARTGPYTPVVPSGANVIVMRLRFFR